MKFNDLNIPVGFMTDQHIRLSLNEGFLIDRGSWEDEFVRHASYTLRIGDHVEIANAVRANVEEDRHFERHDLSLGQHVELYPGDTAKLYSMEVIRLPESVLAFTVSRGLMFFESLVPENTYVDPGFSGNLYTTVTNLSNRVIRLDYGDPIARLFFYRLTVDVEESYRKGSTKGLKQRLNSRRATHLGTELECHRSTRGEIISDIRRLPVAGNQIAEVLRRQDRLIAGVTVFAVLLPIFLYLAFTIPFFHKELGSLVSTLLAYLISAVCGKVAPWAWERVKKA